MVTRHIVRIVGAGILALLVASSASAQVSAPRVHAAPVRSQITATRMVVMPSTTMKRTTTVNNQSAKASLTLNRAEAQQDAQRMQRPPLGSLAHPTRPQVTTERPQVAKVGVVGGRR
ncbi:MAG TPA: hypothetical protein VHI99_22320 [Vicinamibacterales bacterium]|jgi:hypothetical protein|nr:hypothetical protein [Vicinamibacterales bacterium]